MLHKWRDGAARHYAPMLYTSELSLFGRELFGRKEADCTCKKFSSTACIQRGAVVQLRYNRPKKNASPLDGNP